MFISCILMALSLVYSQERYNYLAIDGQMQDDPIGPYYFVSQGNSSDAYAKADPFAKALGLSVTFDNTNKTLTFTRDDTTVTLRTTSNITTGLSKHADGLSLNGQAKVSPLGILVDGSSYIAIDPLVQAFGGQSEFDSSSLVLFVDTEKRLASQLSLLATPRYAYHETKSRVALDLPSGSNYQILVKDTQLIVRLPDLTASAYSQTLSDPYLKTLSFAKVEDTLALVIDTAYSLSTSGQGFNVGLVPSEEKTETLYIDFAPDLKGPSVSALTDSVSAAKAPINDQRIVVIDAGHGDHDSGAHSAYATEKHVVLAVSLKLKALLEEQGITVIMTRTGDHFLELEERSKFAKPDINLFVSIHANAAHSSKASGIETWVFGEPLDDSLTALAIEENGGGGEGVARTEEAQQIANSITGNIFREGQLNFSLRLAETVQKKMVQATGANDRGVRQNVFYVIRNSRSPSVLVELGFLSNPDEGQKLATESYQNTLAQALAEGIQEFLDQGSTVAKR